MPVGGGKGSGIWEGGNGLRGISGIWGDCRHGRLKGGGDCRAARQIGKRGIVRGNGKMGGGWRWRGSGRCSLLPSISQSQSPVTPEPN